MEEEVGQNALVPMLVDAGRLLDYAESIATIMGKEYVYISTGHTGLYEKYGYTFYKMEKDIGVEDAAPYSRVALTERFMIKANALILCAVKRRELTDAMNVGNWRNVPKAFTRRAMMAPRPAKPRLCS